MEVNYVLIVVATIAQFILGGLWYSPLLFGKWWMQFMECDHLSKEELQKMQKSMMPFYGLQLLLTFFTTVSFANLVPYISAFSIYHIAFWIWIGFIVPTQIASVVWANTKRKFWLKQIFVMVFYQLVGIMLTAWILSF
ncbi:MAG: hypothetical protein A2664_02290 [Candidatus Taylorbacteria bacterium RIFCSPHIGHO2_01_FULL_46_22b]|uniref:DUF1761 domain-containing protein n=1 Tax=Candidatus Taylorbacteria bacterium RIFCSPHIGHO2_01_FULL_46_22b TaxID=1802301 RepID=A0A1G2M583_9BACT|nr:MAG: hypothetical protein A2664_02290 [Candidatus Taylorbacteria bacterium RIFCSPHIGHO2_01_FULL_46_22b]